MGVGWTRLKLGNGTSRYLQSALVLRPPGGTPARLRGDVSCEWFWHGLKRQTHLSLQLPGWPTVPVQWMIMLTDREGPGQKSPPVSGQTKELVAGLLLPEMS